MDRVIAPVACVLLMSSHGYPSVSILSTSSDVKWDRNVVSDLTVLNLNVNFTTSQFQDLGQVICQLCLLSINGNGLPK